MWYSLLIMYNKEGEECHQSQMAYRLIRIIGDILFELRAEVSKIFSVDYVLKTTDPGYPEQCKNKMVINRSVLKIKLI